MAAAAALSSSGLALCPSFAVVCSFLERYGAALDLPEMSFPQMETYLRDTSTVPKPLVELHVKLLRKLGKSVTTDRWEKYLAKVCQELNSTWAWELEQRGYQEMTMECKSSILKYLCECQFDDNLKFKMAINEEQPETMRLQPIGRDRQGLMYWLQLDQEQNIRLYTEEQDDLDGSTWRCIVRSRNDLADALELLKAQGDPNPDQVGSRGASPTLDMDDGSTEKLSDGERTVTLKEEPIKQEAQQECCQVKEAEKRECKRPGAAEGCVPLFDNHVSTITTVKAESKEPLRNTVSVLIAPGNAKQEVQQATMRSSQQATIPLKKRELKLSESYQSNHLSNSSSCSIIVFNPSVIQTTDTQSSSGPELTNGRALLLLPHKIGQNGVTGATVSHAGVIRNPQHCSKPQSTGQQQPNDPVLYSHDQRGVRRQSVLVQKAGAHTAKINVQSPVLSLKPNELGKVAEEEVDLSNGARKVQGKETVKEDTVENSCATGYLKDDKNESTSTFGKVGEVTTSTHEQEADKAAVNGKLSSANVKETPMEEASSELQKEGIRLKIKIPPHRRTKLRASAKQQQSDRGVAEDEPPLRRSARICRPSSKAAESQKKKVGRRNRPFHLPDRAAQEEPKSGRAVGQSRKLRGRPRWTAPRSKRHRVEQEAHVEDQSQPDEQREPESHCEGSSTGDACTQCGLPNHPELILLCDWCDNGYHTACLRPPLMLIPEGEWFCPPCQHKQLCEKLEEQLQNLDTALRRRELAERRRERLVYVGISVENIIPEDDEVAEKSIKKKASHRRPNLGRRSTRARKLISYRFDDFDDAIDEAIEEDRDLSGRRSKAVSSMSVEGTELRRPTRGRADEGTEIHRVIRGHADGGIEIQQPVRGRTEGGAEIQRPMRGHPERVRKRRKRRLNDLESDSTAADSEDEFLLSHSSEEEEEVGVSGADDEEDEADSEVCSWESGSHVPRAPRGRPGSKPGARPRVGRPRIRTPLEEDSDEDMDSDAFSVMSDSDEDKSRRALRRGQRQQVNYCESSSDTSEATTLKVRRRRQERLSSDYSDVSAFSRDSEEDYGDEEDTRRRRTVKDLSRIRVGKRHRQSAEGPQRTQGPGAWSQRPSTDSDTSQSSEEDRPLRRRLNRIASDEDEPDHSTGRKTRAPTGPHRKHKGPSREQDSGNSGPNSPQS